MTFDLPTATSLRGTAPAPGLVSRIHGAGGRGAAGEGTGRGAAAGGGIGGGIGGGMGGLFGAVMRGVHQETKSKDKVPSLSMPPSSMPPLSMNREEEAAVMIGSNADTMDVDDDAGSAATAVTATTAAVVATGGSSGGVADNSVVVPHHYTGLDGALLLQPQQQPQQHPLSSPMSVRGNNNTPYQRPPFQHTL